MATLVLGIAVAVNGFGLLLGLGYLAHGAESSWLLMAWGTFVAVVYGGLLLIVVAPALIVRIAGVERALVVISLFALASASPPLGLILLTSSANASLADVAVLGVFAGVGVLNWFALRTRVMPLTVDLPNSSVQPTPASGRG